eukprot:jgi/Mesen1/4217/ME000219S03348
MPPSNLDLFSKQAAKYVKYRPTYPAALFDFVASLTPHRGRVWDVGTGNGQAAVELATRFESVVATDLSEAQISHAKQRDNVVYAVTSPVMTDEEVDRIIGPPGSVDVVTVAQALHWFDFDKFYASVKRVLRKPGGVVAAWGYGIFTSSSPELDEVMQKWYVTTFPFWEPQRVYVDEGYRTIPFDLEPLPGKEDLGTGPVKFEVPAEMPLEGLFGYLESWSAVQTAKEKGVDLLDSSTREAFSKVWGDSNIRTIYWPIFMRIGTAGPV